MFKDNKNTSNHIVFKDTEENNILAAAIEQSSVAVVLTDIDGDIIYVNKAFENMTGYDAKSVIGENPRILKSGFTSPRTYKKMWRTISNGQVWNGEQINKRKDGSLYYEDSRITPIYNEKGELSYYLGIKHDITDRKALESKLKEIAIKDSLTDAFNRRYLSKQLKEIGENYLRTRDIFSIAIVDLDKFKNINDTYGHQVGDMVLVNFVSIIMDNIRSYDIVGRYGGEEFLIVFPDTEKDEAVEIVHRLLKIVREKDFKCQCQDVNITFSAGIASSDELDIDGFDIGKLVKLADDRMYNAKNQGRNQIFTNGG